MSEVIELLTKAREHYRDYGGARGHLREDGTVCAVGALMDCTLGEQVSTDDASNRRSPAWMHLNRAARELYDDTIVNVNDHHSGDYRAAVLDCYDKAIKDLENEH